MELADSPFLEKEMFMLDVSDAAPSLSAWTLDQEVRLFRNADVLVLAQNGVTIAVKPRYLADRIDSLVTHGDALWVLRKLSGKKISVQCLNCRSPMELALDIAVGDWIVDFLQSKPRIQVQDTQQALEWIADEFIVKSDGKADRVIVALHLNQTTQGFTLLGRTWAADLRTDPDKGTSFERLRPITTRPSGFAVITGDIRFLDNTAARLALSPASRAALEDALRSNGDYLALWHEYGELEWKHATARAQKIGILKYTSKQPYDDESTQWAFTIHHSDNSKLKAFVGAIQSGGGHSSQVAFSDELPGWLDGADLIRTDQPQTKKSATVQAAISHCTATQLIVTSDDRLHQATETGYVYLSLIGDLKIRERRDRARESIDQPTDEAMPRLRYVLEGVPLAQARRRPLEALTPYARETFSSAPTERQRKALDVALNTPDVAIIVGPPGTGKTQVIAALQRRLAEELGAQGVKHQVLISCFQHEAVESVLSRVDVYGLPPLKVGGRQRGGQHAANDPVESWRNDRAIVVRARLAQFEDSHPQYEVLRNLSREIGLLRFARLSSEEKGKRLLDIGVLIERLATYDLRLPGETAAAWSAYLHPIKRRGLSVSSKGDNRLLLRIVRGLRVTAVSFADDGSNQAWRLRSALKKAALPLTPEDAQWLQRAEDCLAIPDALLLESLTSLRDRLLDQLMPQVMLSSVKHPLGSEGQELLTRIELAYDKALLESRAGAGAVLADYAESLSSEPDRIRAAIGNYVAVLGATCQQAAANQMASLKQVGALETPIRFDTVVVDEAARANPLDLFIPMSMARRRIVLVGDDRQLPHLLVPELESELIETQELTTSQQESLRKSLFGRLKEQLRKMQDEDGCPRVVTLDTQFRMHPVLGNFVSREFYEREGEEALKSGRPASDFIHSLPGYQGKVAGWLNVPHADGRETKSDTSRERQVEARKLAIEVRRLMQAATDLSFGVITFYAAQRELILKELELLGVMMRADDESWSIRPEWASKTLRDGDERLRIGSVDAFQGREFDVVLLSSVRSNEGKTLPSEATQEDRDDYWTSRYGFLRLSNRMNVAMSRQRRLLIVVGDAAMAKHPDAEDAAHALRAFHDLCRSEHGVVL